MSSQNPEDIERYVRQIALFGAEGQARMSKASIAVVGLGGLGSHICQQMAYLGVQHWIIIDHDVVDESNLNRLIGATQDDIGTSKTEIAKRLIGSIQPTSTVEVVTKRIPDPSIDEAVKSVDLIFGCLDNDYPRSLLLKVASENRRRYIDCATDVITEGGLFYGGRMLNMGSDRGCLHCLGELDQNMIRRAQMNPEELEVEAKIYGVPVETLTASGPSVVNLNGVVASLGSVEAMAILTGLRAPKKLLNYRAHLGTVNSNKDEPLEECYYCSMWGF
jgi:hypothetical protein